MEVPQPNGKVLDATSASDASIAGADGAVPSTTNVFVNISECRPSAFVYWYRTEPAPSEKSGSGMLTLPVHTPLADVPFVSLMNT